MSETEIYYFSGTGNSLHVARELQKQLPGAKLIPMLKMLNYTVESKAETVGLVFPVYLTGLPVPVTEFLQKTNLSSAVYIFAIATYGGNMTLADISVERLLKKKNKELAAQFQIVMTNNSPVGIMPPSFPGFQKIADSWIERIAAWKITEREQKMQEQLTDIARMIKAQEHNTPTKFKDKVNAFFRHLLSGLFTGSESNKGKNIINYYADTTCTGCGICAKVCLSKRVQMENQKPVWQPDKPCYLCYACFNFCPEQAVLVKESYTQKRGRYVCPGILAADIAAQK